MRLSAAVVTEDSIDLEYFYLPWLWLLLATGSVIGSHDLCLGAPRAHRNDCQRETVKDVSIPGQNPGYPSEHSTLAYKIDHVRVFGFIFKVPSWF